MTINVRLDTDTEQALVLAAKAEGLSKSEYVRRCIAKELVQHPPDRAKLAWETGKDLFGRHGSGRSDASENAETILKEIFDAKRRRS